MSDQQFRTPGEWPAPAAPSRSRRWPFVLLVIATVLVCAQAGLLAGSATASAFGYSLNPDVVGPDELPQLPDGFPDGTQRYIRGLTVTQITEEWIGATDGWVCEQVDERLSELSMVAHETVCGLAGRDLSPVRITLRYDADDQVAAVSGDCQWLTTDRKDLKLCRRLLAELAGRVVAAGTPDQQREAKKWARRNMQGDASAVFGDVHLWAPVNDKPVIEMRPAA